jgi:hypothetical protein
MKQGEMNIQLSVKEIVEVCCPDCKLKVRELVKEKVTDQMVDQVLGDPAAANKEGGT